MNHVYDSYDSEIYVIFIELAQYGDEQDFLVVEIVMQRLWGCVFIEKKVLRTFCSLVAKHLKPTCLLPVWFVMVDLRGFLRIYTGNLI